MKKILCILVFGVLLFAGIDAALASAGFGLNNTANQAGYQTTGASATIAGRVQLVVSAILGLMALAFFLLTMYGGIIWLTARGNDEKVSSAKAIIEAAVIGLVIVSASYAIATFVVGRMASDQSKICTTMDFQCWPINSPEEEQSCTSQGYTVETGTCD